MTESYTGTIVKGVGGFYYVDTADTLIECRARGGFRKEGIKPLVGDNVEISVDVVSHTGYVNKILPRRNELKRPPVANVTQIAVVISTKNPKPNLYLTDKMLAYAESIGIDILVCVNKIDMDRGNEICEIYENAGFCVIPLSAKTDENTEILKKRLCDSITVFAGNSGVGKSSLLNRIIGEKNFETGAVSDKIERGRHTTRHSELVKLKDGGYIIDTPGFGVLDLSELDKKECADLFREFAPYYGGCKFTDCRHISEPGCAILDAVKRGDVSKKRHESFVKLIEEIENNKK